MKTRHHASQAAAGKHRYRARVGNKQKIYSLACRLLSLACRLGTPAIRQLRTQKLTQQLLFNNQAPVQERASLPIFQASLRIGITCHSGRSNAQTFSLPFEHHSRHTLWRAYLARFSLIFLAWRRMSSTLLFRTNLWSFIKKHTQVCYNVTCLVRVCTEKTIHHQEVAQKVSCP
jgi:hypothetical protein